MPPNLQCLIVDDEDLAVSLLEAYAEKTEGLVVAGTCHHAVEAQSFLKKAPVDLIFLDVQMPYKTGLDFIRELEHPPAVIFTTSYAEYAVEAFNLAAVDYLLKPFPYERFLVAVEKAKAQRQQTPRDEHAAAFFVKQNSALVKIFYKDVLFIQGFKQYVKIVTTARPIVTLESMKNLEAQLPKALFMRLHKSYIVAVDKIQSLSRQEVVINQNAIPVGKTFEPDWLKYLATKLPPKAG